MPQSFTLTAYLVKQLILAELSVVPVGSTDLLEYFLNKLIHPGALPTTR